MEIEPKLGAHSYISNLCSRIDLHAVAKYLPIDDEIIGIRWNDIIRGDYSSKKKKITDVSKSKKFPNQMSIIVYPKILDTFNLPAKKKKQCKHINVKIFQNGQLQLTGCPTAEIASEVINFVLQKLRALTMNLIIPVVNDFGLLINPETGQIYNYSGQFIGYRAFCKKLNMTTYAFHCGFQKRDPNNENSTLIEILDYINPHNLVSRAFNDTTKCRNIYDRAGNIVAIQKLLLHPDYDHYTFINPPFKKNRFLYAISENKKRIRLKLVPQVQLTPNSAEICNFNVFTKFNVKVGYSVILMNQNYVSPNWNALKYSEINQVHVSISALMHPETAQFTPPHLTMMNGNYRFPFEINTEQLAQICEKRNLIVDYDSENNNNRLCLYWHPQGSCICKKNVCKCKTSVVIFSTGSIMISTAKKQYIYDSIDLIKNIFDEEPSVLYNFGAGDINMREV